MSETTCPIFYPTMEEFCDFKSYVGSIQNAATFGICKIVPPSGWFCRSYDISEIEEIIPKLTATRQVVTGVAGVFDVALFEVHDMTVSALRDVAQRNRCPDGDPTEIERRFWKSLGISSEWESPLYGADIPGTLFDGASACSWNVDRLDSLLQLLGDRLPGVNSSYLYIGAWRTLFAWHTEDLDLYSINYLHAGATKSWYAVSPKDRVRFESFANGHFPADYSKCNQFLRHKTKLFSPSRIKQHGLSLTTAMQRPGEFVITFPGSYHAGFSHGFNIAESTNFATPDWLEYGRRAKYCVCRPGSVRIHVKYLETLYLRELQSQSQIHVNKMSTAAGSSAVVNNSESETQHPTIRTSKSRLRCGCGQDRYLSTAELAKGSSQLYMCTGCGLWSHRNCAPFSPLHSAIEKGSHAKTLICSLCAMAEQLDAEAAANANYDDKSEESTQRVMAKVSQADTRRNNNKGVSGSPITRLLGAIGTEVWARTDDHPREWIKGVVTDSEEGLVRVHQHGHRRDQDHWVNAATDLLPSDVTPPGVHTTTLPPALNDMSVSPTTSTAVKIKRALKTTNIQKSNYSPPPTADTVTLTLDMGAKTKSSAVGHKQYRSPTNPNPPQKKKQSRHVSDTTLSKTLASPPHSLVLEITNTSSTLLTPVSTKHPVNIQSMEVSQWPPRLPPAKPNEITSERLFSKMCSGEQSLPQVNCSSVFSCSGVANGMELR